MNPDSRAVFFDRDGTLNMEKSYLCDPEQLFLFPEVIPSLCRLGRAGFEIFIVTNQSGIGRGYYTEDDMHRVNERLLELLRPHGIHIRHIYFAPEAPECASYGRKPSPRFLLDAQRDFGVDLKRSFMVGDKLSDLECGANAGVSKSILVRTGYGSETESKLSETQQHPWLILNDLGEVTDWILAH